MFKFFKQAGDIVAAAQREAELALSTFTKAKQRLEKANEHLGVAKIAARLAAAEANERHDLAHRLETSNNATIAKLAHILGE